MCIHIRVCTYTHTHTCVCVRVYMFHHLVCCVWLAGDLMVLSGDLMVLSGGEHACSVARFVWLA